MGGGTPLHSKHGMRPQLCCALGSKELLAGSCCSTLMPSILCFARVVCACVLTLLVVYMHASTSEHGSGGDGAVTQG